MAELANERLDQLENEKAAEKSADRDSGTSAA